MKFILQFIEYMIIWMLSAYMCSINIEYQIKNSGKFELISSNKVYILKEQK